MESRARDLATVETLRRARIELVRRAAVEPLASVLSVDHPASQTWLVKVLDVVPGLGKVAGRRLMASLGLDQSVRIADLSEDDRSSILRAVAP